MHVHDPGIHMQRRWGEHAHMCMKWCECAKESVHVCLSVCVRLSVSVCTVCASLCVCLDVCLIVRLSV
jgi:hypothetical protein